jgi:hypothetical protein
MSSRSSNARKRPPFEVLKDWNIASALRHAQRRAREVLRHAGYPSRFPAWVELTARKDLPLRIKHAVDVLFWAHALQLSLDKKSTRDKISFQAFRFGIACDRADLESDFFIGRSVRTKRGVLAEQRGNRNRNLVSESEKTHWRKCYSQLKKKSARISKRVAASRIKTETASTRSERTIRRYL